MSSNFCLKDKGIDTLYQHPCFYCYNRSVIIIPALVFYILLCSSLFQIHQATSQPSRHLFLQNSLPPVQKGKFQKDGPATCPVSFLASYPPECQAFCDHPMPYTYLPPKQLYLLFQSFASIKIWTIYNCLDVFKRKLQFAKQ